MQDLVNLVQGELLIRTRTEQESRVGFVRATYW